MLDYSGIVLLPGTIFVAAETRRYVAMIAEIIEILREIRQPILSVLTAVLCLPAQGLLKLTGNQNINATRGTKQLLFF